MIAVTPTPILTGIRLDGGGKPHPSRGCSMIDAVSRLARKRGAVDFCLGAPDYPPNPEVLRAAAEAVRNCSHIYGDPCGLPEFRAAAAAKVERFRKIQIEPETEVTITCGATEGLALVLRAVLEPGGEVVLFQPGYESYPPAVLHCGGVPRFVRLWPPQAEAGSWEFDEDELVAAFGPRTRALILNTPHNPTGKVFGRPDLERIAALCERHGCWIISDEIYEEFVFGGRTHMSPIELHGIRNRTAVISSLSKTYGVPGWRLGYVLAPPAATRTIRCIQEAVSGGAAVPLQAAGAAALRLPVAFYERLKCMFAARRERLLRLLRGLGMFCPAPEGGWYVMAAPGALGSVCAGDFASFLMERAGVAAAPGGAFYQEDPHTGHGWARLCFGRSEETLAEGERLLSVLSTSALTTDCVSVCNRR